MREPLKFSQIDEDLTPRWFQVWVALLEIANGFVNLITSPFGYETSYFVEVAYEATLRREYQRERRGQ